MTAPTTFVIGAGASVDFGLPTGEALTEKIVGEISVVENGYGGLHWDHDIYRAFCRHRPSDREAQQQFLKAAVRVRNGIKTSPSIDEFLNNHANDKTMTLVGKLAIAYCILIAEQNSSLRSSSGYAYGWAADEYEAPKSDNEDPRSIVDGVDKSWIHLLFKRMTPKYSTENVNDIFTGVRFVSFNYDRCVEEFFFNALQAHYSISAAEAGKVVGELDIVHPYGSIGGLSYAPNQQRPVVFGQLVRHVDLMEMAANIRTFAEQQDVCPVQSDVEAYMNDGGPIVFLGFGFHAQNIKLLKREKPGTIMGTCLDESLSNLAVFKKRLEQANLHGSKRLKDMTCSEFMKEYGVELTEKDDADSVTSISPLRI